MMQRGFTLLIAVLIGSLMLAIGFSIFNISYKELILSSSARDSHISFYAADTGLECALYWDQQEDSFSVSNPSSSITCLESVHAVTRSRSGSIYYRTFSLSINDNAQCARVEVAKYTSGGPCTGGVCTVIDSQGISTGCTSDSTRATERGLRIEYRGI